MKYIKEYNEYLNNNFWKWFGDSKMVDSNGNPKIYYHGSQKEFTEFNDKLIGSFTGNEGHYGRGFYFTDTERNAKIWADPYKKANNTHIYQVYLKMEKPFIPGNDNLYEIGKKYELSVPNKQPIAIDLGKISNQLKDIDNVASDLLDNMIKYGYEKGWSLFLKKYDNNIPDTKIDLNDLNDWCDYNIGNDIKSIPVFIIEDIDNLGIKDYIVYGFEYDIQLHYLTELGQSTQGWTQAIKDEGYDGIIAGDEIVVFNSTQIKSATNNNGDFNLKSNNINESNDFKLPVVVYHGTNKKFDKFDKETFNLNEPKGDYIGEGFFFHKINRNSEEIR